jgi:hypothetical protein
MARGRSAAKRKAQIRVAAKTRGGAAAKARESAARGSQKLAGGGPPRRATRGGRAGKGSTEGGGPVIPKPPNGAEIVVRQGFVIDATGKGPLAIPEVVLLANADGLRFLSQVFAALAEQAGSRSGAAAEPVYLPRLEHPINAQLSDDLDFRFAALTAFSRRALFRRFGIDRKSRQHGSLFERYQQMVSQFGRLSNLMRREGLLMQTNQPSATEGAPASDSVVRA